MILIAFLPFQLTPLYLVSVDRANYLRFVGEIGVRWGKALVRSLLFPHLCFAFGNT